MKPTECKIIFCRYPILCLHAFALGSFLLLWSINVVSKVCLKWLLGQFVLLMTMLYMPFSTRQRRRTQTIKQSISGYIDCISDSSIHHYKLSVIYIFHGTWAPFHYQDRHHRYMDSYYKDVRFVRSSYLYNDNFHAAKTSFLTGTPPAQVFVNHDASKCVLFIAN